MKNINSHKSFQYNYGKNKVTIVEFDIIYKLGKKVPNNISLTSNWRVHYPKNPEITLNSNGEYGFFDHGIFCTNGDIQQMIKRIFQIINETED